MTLKRVHALLYNNKESEKKRRELGEKAEFLHTRRITATKGKVNK